MNLTVAGRIFTVATGLAALIFMGYVFYNESFLHKGVLFIEPNLYIAGGELLTVVASIVVTAYLFLKDLPAR